MKQCRPLLSLVTSLLFCHAAVAACSVADDPPAKLAAPTLLGITILGNPSLRLSSASDYTNGVTLDHNTLQLNVSVGLTWSLQIRALDNLRYQTYSIPVSAVGVQAISLGTRPEILLSTSNQVLASGFATSVLNAVMAIRYRATGGPTWVPTPLPCSSRIPRFERSDAQQCPASIQFFHVSAHLPH